ncbi:hypothetical protein F53441_14203 [Fusarium austroafricanum]|uniref:Carboxylic ester hydrolase n=1 Tax=Fusarium austroafricanum TaxID=2364996 RepID=A0A8H4JFS4_9HYPO|nr:hypothetical protein F53441_14203 [Fusarium austroafricanum]
MRQPSLVAMAALASTSLTVSLLETCTVSNSKASLPSNGTLLGIDMISSSTHGTKGDRVNIKYAFPDPSSFKKRFYVAGGGGYSLNTDTTGGLKYGAAAGATDGGYDAFNCSLDEKFLLGNGSIN